MVMINKAVLNSVPFPIVFLFLQLVVAVGLLKLLQVCRLLQLPQITLNTTKKIWKLIAVNVSGLAFNTLTLQLVDASFYQVARALVLPLTVFLTWIMLRQETSRNVMFACCVVCCGFFAGTVFESIHIDPLGIFFGLLSSSTTALHAIVIKQSLDAVDGNTMDLVYYNNVLSAVCLVPFLFMISEGQEAVKLVFDGLTQLWSDSGSSFDGTMLKNLLLGSLLAGFFGFLINIAGFFQIKVTSPVTHMISSAVRGVLQTLLAMWVFSEVVTGARTVGIVLVLIGSSMYTWFRMKESRQQEYEELLEDDLEKAEKS